MQVLVVVLRPVEVAAEAPPEAQIGGANSEAQLKLSVLTEASLALLELLLPRHVIEYMCLHTNPSDPGDLASLATQHEAVTILFADIVGFTEMSKEVPPIAVMTFLNGLYSAYDALCDEYGVYKVETVGDCYVSAVAGLEHLMPCQGTRLVMSPRQLGMAHVAIGT